MTAVLIDSNVLLDLMTEDPRWYMRSAEAVEKVADGGETAKDDIEVMKLRLKAAEAHYRENYGKGGAHG